MKFMLMLKADDANQEDRMPTDEELNEMGRYNEKLIESGVLLAGEGLHPAQTGSLVNFDAEERTVTDGPFTETKELIAGFWIIQVDSREEAEEWARRCPLGPGSKLEMRRLHEPEDFPQDSEYIQKEKAWREQLGTDQPLRAD